MKKYLLLILISTLIFKISFSQADTTRSGCSTPDMDTTEFKQLPWFDNNEFLENFLDSIGYPSGGSGNRLVNNKWRAASFIKQ